MKTAMQRLITSLETMGITFPLGIQQTFLAIEKEQIKIAWYNGAANGMGLFEINTGDEYYKHEFDFQMPEKEIEARNINSRFKR